jgi:Leucine-rich repeat (LRR) protein
MNLDQGFKEWLDWPECVTCVSDIDASSDAVHFYREKNSFKGIYKFTNITRLLAKQVNQEFLNEISQLTNLEYLELETVTAQTIGKLAVLPKLRFLKIQGARNAVDFAVLLDIVTLQKLFIETAKHLKSIDFISNAHQLVVLGIDGGMYTKQKLESVRAISGLKNLRALYLTSVQLVDKNLDYLSTNPKLTYLRCARFAPKSSFDSLKDLMPNINCSWCDNYDV